MRRRVCVWSNKVEKKRRRHGVKESLQKGLEGLLLTRVNPKVSLQMGDDMESTPVKYLWGMSKFVPQ